MRSLIDRQTNAYPAPITELFCRINTLSSTDFETVYQVFVWGRHKRFSVWLPIRILVLAWDWMDSSRGCRALPKWSLQEGVAAWDATVPTALPGLCMAQCAWIAVSCIWGLMTMQVDAAAPWETALSWERDIFGDLKPCWSMHKALGLRTPQCRRSSVWHSRSLKKKRQGSLFPGKAQIYCSRLHSPSTVFIGVFLWCIMRFT